MFGGKASAFLQKRGKFVPRTLAEKNQIARHAQSKADFLQGRNRDADETNLTALLGYDGAQGELFFRLYESGIDEVIFTEGDVVNIYISLDIYDKDGSSNASAGTFGKSCFLYYNFNVDDSGIISSSADGLGKQLFDALMDGDTVNIVINAKHAGAGTAEYRFTVDGNGFSSACDELN